MPPTTEKYYRKPLVVDALQVTPENFGAVADWCHGTIMYKSDYTPLPLVDDMVLRAEIDPDNQYIHVRVLSPKNVRQTRAFVGDWVLSTELGYKVYKEKAFRNSFDPEPSDQLELALDEGMASPGYRALSPKEFYNPTGEEEIARATGW